MMDLSEVLLFACALLIAIYGIWISRYQRTNKAPSEPELKINANVADDTNNTSKGALEDPSPAHDFDLSNATVRKYLYANKTVRYPYYQVCLFASCLHALCDRSFVIVLTLNVVEDHGASTNAHRPLDRN